MWSRRRVQPQEAVLKDEGDRTTVQLHRSDPGPNVQAEEEALIAIDSDLHQVGR
ncbi:hypothetical protein D3C75_1084550 [compost metagenome]